MGPAWPLEYMIPAIAVLVAAYILSFRMKPPQEQSRYHVLPAELRMQGYERETRKEKIKEQADPWKSYEAGAPADEPVKPSFDSEPIPARRPARAETPADAIEKGSKWH
jgi:hypothetical protein